MHFSYHEIPQLLENLLNFMQLEFTKEKLLYGEGLLLSVCLSFLSIKSHLLLLFHWPSELVNIMTLWPFCSSMAPNINLWLHRNSIQIPTESCSWFYSVSMVFISLHWLAEGMLGLSHPLIWPVEGLWVSHIHLGRHTMHKQTDKCQAQCISDESDRWVDTRDHTKKHHFEKSELR